jgi:hypothetical protein
MGGGGAIAFGGAVLRHHELTVLQIAKVFN